MEKLELEEAYPLQREIPDYGFAGREDLEEIWLPPSIERIGRYAFYNCRNLRKITFHSDIRDVGSGAFTGCHKVCHLDVTIVKDKPSCLKEILQELTEEMLVEYRSDSYARLMFPEYFEEGVENTPARILMTEIHGSGLKYRNCFLKTEFQFEEYDARFPYAKAWESEHFLREMVLGRLMYPLQLKEKYQKVYEQYLLEHLEGIGRELMEEEDAECFRWLAEHYGQAESALDCWIEQAGRLGNPVFTGMLLEMRKGTSQNEMKMGVPTFEF